MGSRPHFALFDEFGKQLLAYCTDVAGFFYASEPGRRIITLRQCSPRPSFLDVATQARVEQVDVSIAMLDSQARPFASELVCGLKVGDLQDSDTPFDLPISGTTWSAPTVAARPIWDRWSQGSPQVKNLWAAYAPNGREAWLDLVCRQRRRPGTDVQNGVFHLDGRYITSLTSFYLAIGEAINGPGGYFGAGYFWFEEALKGGYGAMPPFTLIWNDWEIAAARMRFPYHPADGTPADCFEMTVAHLRQAGAEIILP